MKTIIAIALSLFGVASAQFVGPSPLNVNGRSEISLSAPSYVSSASSGSNGFACTANGCRLDLGTGASDYLFSDGVSVKVPATFVAGGSLYGSSVYADLYRPNSIATLTTSGAIADGATAIAVKVGNSVALSTAGASITAFYSDNMATKRAWIDLNGFLSSATEDLLTSCFFNAAAAIGTCPATGTGCIGHTLPPKPFTITGLTTYVSVIGGGGAGSTVFTMTDGTNTCTATLACASVTNTTGSKRVTTTNAGGAGCVFPSNAAIVVSVSTAGCTTTQPTLRNVDLVGKWQ